jgi:hypothetical protein
LEVEPKSTMQGRDPVGNPAADLASHLRQQFEEYVRVIREANIQEGVSRTARVAKPKPSNATLPHAVRGRRMRAPRLRALVLDVIEDDVITRGVTEKRTCGVSGGRQGRSDPLHN